MKISSLLTSCLCIAFLACGDDDSMGRPDVEAPPPPASLAEAVAFEGMRSFVTEVTLADGTSLEGAVITPAEGAPFEILEQRCVAERCGLVLTVLDTRPNRGVGVPATIDAVNHFLRVQTTGALYQALLPVRPLDEVTGRGTEPSTFREPIILATNVVIDPGATLQSGFAEPVRWVSFGDVQIAGTLDASANELVVGGAGGVAGNAGEGLGEGGVGGGAAGGGGAGHAEMGGMGATGEGGAAYGLPSIACMGDFSQLACGGSGGGGDTGAGGDGATGVFVVSLGTFTLDGVISARGGDGASGGGGGSVLLAAPAFEGSGTVDVSGGAGDGTGGDGSAGRVRIDTPGTGGPSDVYRGVAVSLAGVPRIVESASLTLTGVASADAAIEVQLVGGSLVADGSADASGAFSIDVPLAPGLNRLAIEAVDADGARTRNWVGTNIRFERVPGRMAPVPTSATVDVVRLR